MLCMYAMYKSCCWQIKFSTEKSLKLLIIQRKFNYFLFILSFLVWAELFHQGLRNKKKLITERQVLS